LNFRPSGKVGYPYVNDMTPARAYGIRAEWIENKRLSRKEIQEQQEAQKQAELGKWTISRLWEEYKARNPNLKGIATDENRSCLHINPKFGEKEPRELVPEVASCHR
jgi:hypothetical protein